MAYGQYFFITLILIVTAAAAKDPFHSSPRQPADNPAIQQTDTQNRCRKPRSVIAAGLPLSELHVNGTVIQKDKHFIILSGGSEFFIAHRQDFIAKEALQIIAIDKKEIQLADWRNSIDCEQPNITTLQF